MKIFHKGTEPTSLPKKMLNERTFKLLNLFYFFETMYNEQ